MVENDFAEATSELHPKKQKPEKAINKKKRKSQQQNWRDGFLSSLGCGERVDFHFFYEYFIKK